MLRTARALSLLAVAFPVACNGGGSADADAGKAQPVPVAVVAPAVALISAYRPHLKVLPATDKYAPKRRPELDRASAAAANEIRHAANGARQKIDASSSPAAKELVTAFQAVAGACADATEDEAVDKCGATIDALDAALQKNADSGDGRKLPRIAPESVTDDAKKAIASLLKTKGPGPAEEAYIKKRGDAATSVADLATACQAAQGEVDAIAAQFEKADEPIRLIAVTHKMSLDSQCHKVEVAEALRKDLEGCRKKAKSTECKIVCSKVKAQLEELPAAVFSTMEKDHPEICKD